MAKYSPTTPSYPTNFWLQGLGQFPSVDSPSLTVDGKVYLPQNTAIFCNKCGSVWARRLTKEETIPEGVVNTWAVRILSCEHCGYGSLWDDYNESWNRSLPKALLLREAAIIGLYRAAGIQTYNDYFEQVVWRKNHG